jgi:hypothetical protein
MEPSGIDVECRPSVAAAGRAGLAAALDRHGPATAVAAPIMVAVKPIMVTIGPVTLMIANAIAVVTALADADAVRPDRHIGLGQRD